MVFFQFDILLGRIYILCIEEYNIVLWGKMMSKHIEWITHKDKEILSVDFSELYEKEFVEKIIELRNFTVKSGKENINELLNISNSYVYGEVLKESQKTAKIVNDQIEKIAVVGVTIVQKSFFGFFSNIMHAKIRTFDSIENAKNWLVKS